MSTTILKTGEVCYKSKPMNIDRAARFARCIDKNTRFYGVEIVPAKAGENFYVQFRTKTNSAYEVEFNARAQRAAVEGADYIFWQDADKGNWWVFNPKSSETYELTLFDCSCPDHEFRCRKAGLHCKHRHALQMYLDKVQATGGRVNVAA